MEEQIYSIFVFRQVARNEYVRCSYSVKYFYKYIFICIPWPPCSINSSGLHKYETKLVENLHYGGRGVFKSLHFIYSILVFVQVALNKYIRYSYSVRYLWTNILNIRIRSDCKKWIYLIFVFGSQSRYEYIRYSYSIKCFL